MAFNRSPYYSTYSTEHLPGAYNLDVRQGSGIPWGAPTFMLSKDAGMVNMLPYVFTDEKGQKQTHAITRNAIHGYTLIGGTNLCRGVYVWEKSVGTVYYYVVIGQQVYTTTNWQTNWAGVQGLAVGGSSPVRFTEFIDGTNTKQLIMVDGTDGYIFTTNAAPTKIVSANFPTPHVPFPVFIDGFLFLAKAGTGDIYNCDLNTPGTWTAGSFISAEMYPDDIQALVKINNYLVAIGTQSCEYFYDAANATASPLARYESAVLPFGTSFPNSIAVNKDTMMLLANNSDGQLTIKIVEDFKSKDVDPSFIVTAMNQRLSSSYGVPTMTPAGVRGYFFRQAGKLYYGLAFDGAGTVNNNISSSFAFCFDTEWWTELRYGTNQCFPVFFSAPATTTAMTTFVAGHIFASGAFNAFVGVFEDALPTFFHTGCTDMLNVNGAPGLQFSAPIYMELRTPNLDFGTMNLKTMNRFALDYTATSSTTSGITIDWADDDYGTWQSSPPNLGTSFTYPFVTQLGSFRRRAFRIVINNVNYWFRFKGIEVDINKGYV